MWNGFRHKLPGEKGGNAPRLVQDPVTGSVIGEASTDGEVAQMLAENAQEWKDAA